METISNIANAASKAVFGEGEKRPDGTTEPVAGQTGAGTVNEPYDKGNVEDSTKSASTVPASEQKSTQQPSTTKSPDLDAKDTSGSTDTKKPSGKDAMPHTDEEREALVMKGEFPHDPNDHSGEPLKMHDGSEKKTEEENKGGDPRTEGKTERSKSVSQEGGNPHGKTLGTGEQYVKSSGLAADGGDFDASNPGAGQEATRLQEEKGIHKDKPAAAVGGTAASSTSDVSSKASKDPNKPSKLARLKEKLHIGRGKDKSDKTSAAASTASPSTSSPSAATTSAPSAPTSTPATTAASATPTTAPAPGAPAAPST